MSSQEATLEGEEDQGLPFRQARGGSQGEIQPRTEKEGFSPELYKNHPRETNGKEDKVPPALVEFRGGGLPH